MGEAVDRYISYGNDVGLPGWSHNTLIDHADAAIEELEADNARLRAEVEKLKQFIRVLEGLE